MGWLCIKIMNIVRFPSVLFPRSQMDNLSSQDLVARYPFDNGGADSAFGLFPAQFQDTPYFTFGRLGKTGLYVDGKSGYGLVQQNVGNNMTIAFWLKTPSSGGTAWSSAAGLVDGNSPAADGSLGAGLTNGTVAAAIGMQVITSTAVANDGQWHHIAVTRNGSNGQALIYLDGTQRGSGTGPTGWLTKSKALTVGSLSSDNGILTGAFDDLCFYNFVLTPGAIQALVAATQPAIDINAAKTRIQAESYTRMNGVRLEATADADSGLQIGGISTGSWAEYPINVSAAGQYSFTLRSANPGTAGSAVISIDNAQTGTMLFPAQAGWQNATANVVLPAGLHTLKLSISAGANISVNWIDIAKGSVAASSNWKLTNGYNTIRLTGGNSKNEVLFTTSKSGLVTISLFTANGRLVAQWHPFGVAGRVNRTAFPPRSSFSDGVNMLTLDQERKRVAFERVVIVK